MKSVNKPRNQMWRQNILPGDQDSDQSISDEEDFNVDLRDNCVSLAGRSEKEENAQLQSRLGMLKGTRAVNWGKILSNLSPQKQISVHLEDGVEMPNFPEEAGFIFSPRKASTCDSDEEAISDDENANVLQKFSVTPGVKTLQKDGIQDFGSRKLDGENTWSIVSKEAEELIRLNANTLSSSSSQPTCKVNKFGGGIQSKSKPKFSFRFQSHREGVSSPSISEDDNGIPCKFDELTEKLETADCEKYSVSDLLEDFPGNKARESELVPDEVEDPHWCNEQTVAAHLDGLQDCLPRRNLKMNSRTRRKRMQSTARKSMSLLGDGTKDCEDLLEPMGSRSSSDDEANCQNLKLAVPEMKKQTIVDRFQEALGATSRDEEAFVAVPRATSVGLFEKLQLVVQSEKDTDTEFLQLQASTSPNYEQSCIDVKILSRCLDAKLIVCQVSSAKGIEDPQRPQSDQKTVNGGKERTIIFNPRVCRDVDLEVGNSIRIHPPWKNVQVKENGDSIILSTYFSQISA